MEQSLKKFLFCDTVVGIQNLLDKIFDIRRCLCRSILFLTDRVGNDHIVQFTIKETCHHNDRNSCCKQQHQGKLGFQLHITVRTSYLCKKLTHCKLRSLYSEGESPQYFLKLFPK